MLLRDGTRYRIDNGLVSSIQDRNGNITTFSYDGNGRVQTIVDSLKRQVGVSYDTSLETDCSLHYDVISFTGFGGVARTIQVGHDCLSHALRSDQSLKQYALLFPELGGSGNITPNTFNAKVVSAVLLPDGRQYQFLYNSYAEIARVVLPTGGAYEYDYTATSGVGDDNITGVDKDIFRRVIERRVKPDGTNIEGRTRYSPATGVGGLVTVDHLDANGTTLLARDEHTFLTSGSPAQDGSPPKVLLYSVVLDGMESQVEAKDTNGTTLLRREENTYAQDSVPWTDNGFQWAINPRLTDTLSTILDVSPALVSKRKFSYDQYNNTTSVKEFDFGSNGQLGPLLRETTTTYVASNGYDTVNPSTTNPKALQTFHLRSLPLQQSVFDGPTGLEKARTLYEYDNYNQTTQDNFHAALTNRSDITGLDGSSTTTSYTRGNTTKTTSSLFDTSGNVTSSISGYAQYDIAGNAIKVIDPRSTSSNIIATTLDLSDRFGAPDNEARGNTQAPTELGALHTYAFTTLVTNPLGHTSYAQFDYYSGKPVNSEDANGIVASAHYDDFLDRPTGVDVGIFTGSLGPEAYFIYLQRFVAYGHNNQ